MSLISYNVGKNSFTVIIDKTKSIHYVVHMNAEISIAERKERINKEREMQVFIESLQNKPESIDAFDEELWLTLIEKVKVHHDKHYEVFFKNGQIISL